MTARIFPPRCAHLVVLTNFVGLFFPLSAVAHVGLDSPNGGETLTAGSTFQIEWNPTAPHDTINWDLWYSTNSSSGPWTVIALDLPLGNNNAGSPHFYDWAVPDIEATNTWVRVQQDNTAENYDDVSDNSFAIIAAILGDYDGSGTVGEGDFLEWRSTFGDTVAVGTKADGNSNGAIDAADYTVWRDAASTGSGVGSPVTAIPEPRSTELALLAAAVLIVFVRITPL